MQNIENQTEKRDLAVKSVYETFAKDCFGNEQLMLDSKSFEQKAYDSYKMFVKNKIKTPNPLIIRLGGQSGVGKTTQLWGAIEKNWNEEYYVRLAVGKFAPLHPYYKQIKEDFGESNLREKTNGFSLLFLLRMAELLIEGGYNILWEMTLLDPDFEEYFLRKAKKYSYNLFYNIIAIPKYLSDNFINKRRIKEGRAVYESTADYFFDILPKALEKLKDLNGLFNQNDIFALWAYSPSIIYLSNCCNEQFMQYFIEERKKTDLLEQNEDELKSVKNKFFKIFFSNFV
jgi:hypothetical protein